MFNVTERVVYKEKESVIVQQLAIQSYPLMVQYKIENVTDKPKSFQCEFLSEKFFCEMMEVARVLYSQRRNLHCKPNNAKVSYTGWVRKTFRTCTSQLGWARSEFCPTGKPNLTGSWRSSSGRFCSCEPLSSLKPFRRRTSRSWRSNSKRSSTSTSVRSISPSGNPKWPMSKSSICLARYARRDLENSTDRAQRIVPGSQRYRHDLRHAVHQGPETGQFQQPRGLLRKRHGGDCNQRSRHQRRRTDIQQDGCLRYLRLSVLKYLITFPFY